MKISAVVAAYNQPALLNDTLTMLRSQTRPPDEVIVIDDSKHEQRSGGFAKNEGVWMAKFDTILLCDHDQYLVNDAVESLARALADWESADYKNVIVNLVRVDVPKGVYDDAEDALSVCRKCNLLDDESLNADITSTELCLSLMRRSTYDLLGGYDTVNFPMYGMCNQDFVIRAKSRGCLVTSHVPRISTSKRLYSLDRWHDGKEKYQAESSWKEFDRRYGMPYTPSKLSDMMRSVRES